MEYFVTSFYKFVHFDDPDSLKPLFKESCIAKDIVGTILLAHEGINGTIAGPQDKVEEFKKELQATPGLEDLTFKDSACQKKPFRRMLVKVKTQIVRMRGVETRPGEITGNYVSPEDFKTWLDSNEEMIVVDTRNAFEVERGTFRGSLNPNTRYFSDFVKYVDKDLKDAKSKKIVTFCTGGIRCERATSYMVEQGFTNVYQLEGGILNYFEKTDGKHFEGNCYVFDRRVEVDTDLEPVEGAIPPP